MRGSFAWSFAYRFRSFHATPKVLWLVPAGRDNKSNSFSAALVGFDLHFHTLARATLTGLCCC